MGAEKPGYLKRTERIARLLLFGKLKKVIIRKIQHLGQFTRVNDDKV
jgi:hypothetical protein